MLLESDNNISRWSIEFTHNYDLLKLQPLHPMGYINLAVLTRGCAQKTLVFSLELAQSGDAG